MPVSELRLIKNSLEYLSKDQLHRVPTKTRGIYALYKRRGRATAESHHYDFVYVGMARGLKSGIRGRIMSHIRNKGELWTHFSVFEVWDNIREEEIEELEALFRHLYQYDAKANSLNQQKGYKKLRRLARRTENYWV
jgi:hypothetical protein